MKLQYKILAGFAILAVMLFIAGAWSIIQVKFFGERLEKIIGDKYQKIEVSKTFREIMERKDRENILLYMSGTNVNINANMSEFISEIKNYKQKYSDKDENKILTPLISSVNVYENKWKEILILTGKTNKLELYKSKIVPAFNQSLKKIDKLIDYNQISLKKTIVEIRGRARRAIIPGIVAIIAAIVFTLLFNYFINHYIVKPLNTIKTQIDDFISKGKPIRFQPIMDDEIAKLSESIYLLSSYTNLDEQHK